MKKILLFLFALIGIIAISNAQTNKPITTSNYIIPSYVGNTADTVGGTLTTWYKPISFNVPTANYYNFKVKVTETTAFTCTIALQGKINDSDAYTTITTYTYGGAGTDTTVVFNQPTTKQLYRTYKVLVTRTGGVGKITSLDAVIKY